MTQYNPPRHHSHFPMNLLLGTTSGEIKQQSISPFLRTENGDLKTVFAHSFHEYKHCVKIDIVYMSLFDSPQLQIPEITERFHLHQPVSLNNMLLTQNLNSSFLFAKLVFIFQYLHFPLGNINKVSGVTSSKYPIGQISQLELQIDVNTCSFSYSLFREVAKIINIDPPSSDNRNWRI